jgi:AcrR family transcriptional regulator
LVYNNEKNVVWGIAMARPINEAQRSERKKEILEAAIRIFLKQGVSAKISDIAREAGLSHGHVYNHFNSKEEIIMAIIQEGQERQRSKLIEARDKFTSALQRLAFITNTYFEDEDRYPYVISLEATFARLLSDESKSIILKKSASNLELLISILKEGQQEGTIIDGDPRELAMLYTTMMQNLVLNEIKGNAPVHLTDRELIIKLFSSR